MCHRYPLRPDFAYFSFYINPVRQLSLWMSRCCAEYKPYFGHHRSTLLKSRIPMDIKFLKRLTLCLTMLSFVYINKNGTIYLDIINDLIIAWLTLQYDIKVFKYLQRGIFCRVITSSVISFKIKNDKLFKGIVSLIW